MAARGAAFFVGINGVKLTPLILSHPFPCGGACAFTAKSLDAPPSGLDIKTIPYL